MSEVREIFKWRGGEEGGMSEVREVLRGPRIGWDGGITVVYAGRILLKKLRNPRTSLENALEYSVEKQLPRSIPILAVHLRRRI